MRRSMRVLATLLVGVLAGCGTGGVSGGPTRSTPVQTSSPGPTPNAVTPSALPSAAAGPGQPPTPVPAVGGLTWDRVPDQQAFAGAEMTEVAAGPGGYVAVGCPTDCLSTAWHSADGRTWERVELPAAGIIDGGMHVVGDAAGYVAWGGLVEPDGRAGIWSSTDGTTWRAAPPIEGAVAIESVVRFRGAWFASGGAGQRGAVVFTSPDGVAWEEIPFLDETGAEMAPGDAIWSLAPLVATDDGLLSFGPSEDEGVMTSATFRSTDGSRWRATHELPSGANVGAVVVADGRLVAIGRDDRRDDGSPAGWVWAGGSSWAPAAIPEGPGGLVASGAGALLLLGGEAGQLRALSSPDGMVWTPAGSVPDAAREGSRRLTDCTGGPCGVAARTVVRGLAGGGAGFVAVGSTQLDAGDSRAVVWIGTVSPD